MSELSFTQKRALVAHEIFFGRRYAGTSLEPSNTDEHVATEKMCYILKIAGVEIGDYDYSWNVKGPFSPGLLALLRSIDDQNDEVKKFYDEKTDKNLYLRKYEDVIEDLSEKLKIKEHMDIQYKWVELLGSLIYISRVMLPGENFEKIENRLKIEKKEYSDSALNHDAWDLLMQSQLLCI